MKPILSPINIILCVVAIIFLINGTVRFLKRERNQTFFKFATTIIIWTGVAVFSIFPSLARTITSKLGLGSNLNTLIFIGFIVVFVIIFRILQILEKLDKSITDLVRQQALSKLPQKKNGKF